MSDRRETRGVAVLGLEEVFFSREFGRRPAPRASSTGSTVAPAEPALLEQVFLSEFFGRPGAIAPMVSTVPEPASAASGRPTFIVLKGDGEGRAERESARYRAIAAVSGVAAAALVVAGLSSGTTAGPGPGQPRLAAQGTSPSASSAGPAAGSQPDPSGIGTTSPRPTGRSSLAELTSITALAKPTGGAMSKPTPTSTAPSAPSTPGPTALAPVATVIANSVSTAGSTVSTASGEVVQTLPPIAGAPGTTTSSTMHMQGGGSPATVSASAPRQ